MKEFVLIITMYVFGNYGDGFSSGSATATFSNKEACETAGELWVKKVTETEPVRKYLKTMASDVFYLCVEKQ